MTTLLDVLAWQLVGVIGGYVFWSVVGVRANLREIHAFIDEESRELHAAKNSETRRDRRRCGGVVYHVRRRPGGRGLGAAGVFALASGPRHKSRFRSAVPARAAAQAELSAGRK